MTSMVDITMTLLIIFIIIAPVIEHGIDIALPTSTSNKSAHKQEIVISVSKEGTLYLNNQRTDPRSLGDRLKALKESKPNLAIIIRGDTTVHYGTVVEILDTVSSLEIEEVSLATQVGKE